MILNQNKLTSLIIFNTLYDPSLSRAFVIGADTFSDVTINDLEKSKNYRAIIKEAVRIRPKQHKNSFLMLRKDPKICPGRKLAMLN
ncbi:661_t:CDS:2 [Diversispora eburnea]|uniref:661_t:CDS:1 n=1 Tax=Diversispora eburnea TaxID=1213867 RepID=A0A9N8YZ71_9GLOM|nr:661_t:CDS:2 [Diversispora eburnea]